MIKKLLFCVLLCHTTNPMAHIIHYLSYLTTRKAPVYIKDPLAYDAHGHTVLTRAITQEDLPTITKLLATYPNTRTQHRKALACEEAEIARIHCALQVAATACARATILERLYHFKKILLATSTADGLTPLSLALQTRNPTIIRPIIYWLTYSEIEEACLLAKKLCAYGALVEAIGPNTDFLQEAIEHGNAQLAQDINENIQQETEKNERMIDQMMELTMTCPL